MVMAIRHDRLLHEIEQVYGRDRSAFVRVAQAITGDSETAVEAVQQGFADALRSRNTFRGEGPLEAWLWRSVVNAARKSVRQRGLDRRAADLVGRQAELAVEEVPQEVAELAPLISRLPERQRLVIFLRYYADLDYRAIGAVLGIETGTVSATLASAHRALRRALEEVNAGA
jgi:RNA polymerase sigma-70 factor (ECF subfamily)